ncbi:MULTISPECIES: hypothetical protein [Moritella]|uniref:Uncharacterized protein n=1 Tax=Moritella viscosa TaxID=80854 RepID=A0A090IB74_9GAMM|nr:MULTISPECIES: hypothetical protein [Moritella]QUM86172.1 hypothetical protein HWV02_17485 [Moritella sp. 28]QUM90391.1 hypothetical protein HWV03_17105 [Moritella sp. 36]CED59021.1 putative uncharacterized protein [Moritella viscosa]SGY84814.1 Putative uncharacterized protein [Moritella viscosa]SGY85999.1 Putative uncharacterized protein [Moritella viscosa]
MYIHLNGFDFEFSNQVIASFISSTAYQNQSSDIAGIHLTDTYQQMLHAGISKDELIKAILNYHISALHEEGISVEAIKKSMYNDINVSFLIDIKSDNLARFVNFNDNKKEDSVCINMRNFNHQFTLTYSQLIQLEESYRNQTQEQILILFLETFKTIMETEDSASRQCYYAILVSTGLLLFSEQLSILDAIQFSDIEFELNTDRLLLNLPAGLETCLFELEFNTED